MKELADAKVVFINGLGLEGWLTRLVQASGAKAVTVVASTGVEPLRIEDEHQPGHTVSDPHAWQSIANAKIYVGNIRDGLIKADPAGGSIYAANAKSYLASLDVLEKEVKGAIEKIPADRRKIITTHDAFAYFGKAYGMAFISPEGVSTKSEASARDVAKIVEQIKKQEIPAVFMENVSDPRLMKMIAKETGAKIGGKLYSDALSEPDGPTASYIAMMHNNVNEFSKAFDVLIGDVAADVQQETSDQEEPCVSHEKGLPARTITALRIGAHCSAVRRGARVRLRWGFDRRNSR